MPYLLRAVTMPRPNIVEWWPLYKVKFPLFYYISVLVALYAISCRGKRNIFESVAVILTAYLAWKHYRHGSLYAVTWACFVPVMLQGTNVGDSIESLWKKYTPQLAVAAFALGIVAMGYSINAKFWELQIPNQRATASKRTSTFPVGACEYLSDQKFQGNLFVPFENGAFVSWKLYPEVKISIDSRYEVAFPEGALEEATDFYTAQDNWETILNKYDTHAVLVPNELPIGGVFNERLESTAKNTRGVQPVASIGKFPWRLVYQDNTYSVYARLDIGSQLPFVDRRNEFIKGVFP